MRCLLVALLVAGSACGDKEKEADKGNEKAKDPVAAPAPAPTPADAAPPPPITPAVPDGKPGIQFTELEPNATQPVTPGLPAIREDGKVIAAVLVLRSDDAGDNGASLVLLDAATGKVTRQLPLIADDVHEKHTGDGEQVTDAYREQVVAQTAAANAALAEHGWRPLAAGEPERVDEAMQATVGDLTFTQGEELGAVVIARGGTKLATLDPKKKLKWPKQPKDPECRIRGAMMVRAMHDPESAVAAVEFVFAEGHHCGGYPRQLAVLKL